MAGGVIERLMDGGGQPLRALRVAALRGEIGQLFKQAFLQLIQLRANLLDQVRALVVWRLALKLPVGQVGVLHQFVRLDLRRKELFDGGRRQLVARCLGDNAGDDLLFAFFVLYRLFAVPFAQGDLVGNGQAFGDAVEQRLKGGGSCGCAGTGEQ